MCVNMSVCIGLYSSSEYSHGLYTCIAILGINPYYQKSANMPPSIISSINTSYEDSLTNDDPSFLDLLSDSDDLSAVGLQDQPSEKGIITTPGLHSPTSKESSMITTARFLMFALNYKHCLLLLVTSTYFQ